MLRAVAVAFVVVLCTPVVCSGPVSSTSAAVAQVTAALNNATDLDPTLHHAPDSTNSSHTFTHTSAGPNTPPEPSSGTHTDDPARHPQGPGRGSTTTRTTSKGTASGGVETDAGRSVGILFLIFIVFIILILAVILYALWKKGKRYSFDLTNCEHDTPLRSIEQAGTFEATKGSTLNLDHNPEENRIRTSPVPNGCSGAALEETLCPEQPSVSGDDGSASDSSLSSPVKKVEFNLDLELIGAEPEPAKGATDAPTHDPVSGNDSPELFTEINLDDMQ